MITNIKQLSRIRSYNSSKTLVLTSGTYDLLHVGHVAFLSKARSYGDMLVVMLSSDERVKNRKGDNRPIIDQNDRAKMLDALKLVDYVFIDPGVNENSTQNPIYKKIAEDLRPDFYITDGEDVRLRTLIDKKRYIILPRSKRQISTTEIISKINNL